MQRNHAPIKLVFLARSLDYGGAQTQLISLARALDKNRFSICILTFYQGPLDQRLAGSGVRVISLNKRGRWDIFGFLRRLIQQVRLAQPEVLHGYLDIPNLLGLFLKLFVRTRVVWGLRTSTIALEHYDWLHRLAARLEQRFSHWPDLIIINSRKGLEDHIARGFPREKFVVVANGIDTEVFKPDRQAGETQRREWGVPLPSKCVGIVGRLDPLKDHRNFLQAAALVGRKLRDVRFVCVGDGPGDYRNELRLLANELGLADQLIWQDATTNVTAVYSTLDLLVSASRAEGLPNVVAEAMACGVCCVVTDVGDSRRLVGDCGIVVPPQDPEALAEGIIRGLATDLVAGGGNARARIVENFSTEKLAKLTADAIASLACEVR